MKTLFFARFLAAACLLVSTAFADAEAPASKHPTGEPALVVGRAGQEIVLSWTLSPGTVRSMEIMRHTQRNPSGRTRIAQVRDTRLYVDKVPEAGVTYWYWIKVIFDDGKIINLGPIATPSGDVWTPSS